MTRLIAAVVLGFCLAGCAAPKPVISKIDDSSLEVQASVGVKDYEVRATAREGCGIYDKQPVSISYRCIAKYCLRKAYLFACK